MALNEKRLKGADNLVSGLSPVPALLCGSVAGRVAVPSGWAGFTSRSCLTGPLGMVDDWMYGPTAATRDGPDCGPA